MLHEFVEQGRAYSLKGSRVPEANSMISVESGRQNWNNQIYSGARKELHDTDKTINMGSSNDHELHTLALLGVPAQHNVKKCEVAGALHIFCIPTLSPAALGSQSFAAASEPRAAFTSKTTLSAALKAVSASFWSKFYSSANLSTATIAIGPAHPTGRNVGSALF